MKNIRIPRVVASCVAALFFLSASSAIADVNIGGNAFWHGSDLGATIKILGPHPDLDIQDIIEAITDASEDKPYLIKLAIDDHIAAGRMQGFGGVHHGDGGGDGNRRRQPHVVGKQFVCADTDDG